MDETSDERTGTTARGPQGDPFLAPRLDAEHLTLLRRYGQERPTTAGQVLFREGDRGYDFIVVLSGAVTIIDHEAGVVRELATEGPGEFLAELNILTGERLFATAVVRDPGSVLVVPVDRLQEVIAQDQALSDMIVQTTLRRRQWLAQERAGLRIVGSRSSPDARRLREFAARNRLGRSSWTATASLSPVRTSAGQPATGLPGPSCAGIPTCWRPACRACSRSATCEAAR